MNTARRFLTEQEWMETRRAGASIKDVRPFGDAGFSFQSRFGQMKIFPCEQLAGLKFGIRFGDEKCLYVSPAVFSLLTSDLELMLSSLRIHTLPPRAKLWP